VTSTSQSQQHLFGLTTGIWFTEHVVIDDDNGVSTENPSVAMHRRTIECLTARHTLRKTLGRFTQVRRLVD
jgi:hypothetical protein